jgi:GT2 family glycosyltransferase
MAAVPEIAVVIPTRNRGADAAAAARAVLASDRPIELVVVDQSTDDLTAEALATIDDPRLTVVRSAERGISRARNAGVAVTSAPIVLFTDDDCRPDPDWIDQMAAAFDVPAAPALVFGRVTLPELGPGEFAPAFEPVVPLVTGRVPLSDQPLGIGASFAVRRDALTALGGFDPLLGAGAERFTGAEETDVAIRALHRGMSIGQSASAHVLHLGVRGGDDVRRLIVAYRRAVGAAFGKNLRLAPRRGSVDLIRWAAHELWLVVRDVRARRRPQPGALVHFLLGVAGSFVYAVDRPAQRFRPRRSAGA